MLFLEECLDLLLRDLFVSVGVDFLEEIRWWGGFRKDVDNLDIELQSGTARDIGTRSLVAVTHLRGDDDIGFGTLTEANETLVPSCVKEESINTKL